MRRHVIYWYHLCLNQPGGSRLAKIIREVCHWTGLVAQSELNANLYKICQQFKNRKTIYGDLPPDNIAELKMWDSVHVYLIGLYSKYIRQHQPGVAIINKDVRLTCMTIINPDMG